MIKNYYPTYFITAAAISGDNLVLSVNGSPAMSEHIRFALRFAPRVSIPNGVSASIPVVLSINGASYSFKDKFAEPATFAELPKDRINDCNFSPRYAIVGGVGSSTSEDETSYYFVAWDIPAI